MSGVSVVRIWCPPWSGDSERPQPWHDLDAYLAWQVQYFEQVLQLALENDLQIILCLHTHTEFLEKHWHEEIEERRHSWAGNPYNKKNKGPCRTPRDFFTNQRARSIVSAHLMGLAGRLKENPALLGWDLFNEPDRVDSYSDRYFLQWFQTGLKALRAAGSKHPCTVSFANGYHGRKFWKQVKEVIIQIHCHGWPQTNPLDSIWIYRKFWLNSGLPFFCGEFGWDSQLPPTDIQRRQIPSVIAASVALGCTLPAMPWWWDELMADEELMQALSQLSAGLQQMEPIIDGCIISHYLTKTTSKQVSVLERSVHLIRKFAPYWRFILRPDKLRKAVSTLVHSFRMTRLDAPLVFGMKSGNRALLFVQLSKYAEPSPILRLRIGQSDARCTGVYNLATGDFLHGNDLVQNGELLLYKSQFRGDLLVSISGTLNLEPR